MRRGNLCHPINISSRNIYMGVLSQEIKDTALFCWRTVGGLDRNYGLIFPRGDTCGLQDESWQAQRRIRKGIPNIGISSDSLIIMAILARVKLYTIREGLIVAAQ